MRKWCWRLGFYLRDRLSWQLGEEKFSQTNRILTRRRTLVLFPLKFFSLSDYFLFSFGTIEQQLSTQEYLILACLSSISSRIFQYHV